MSRVLNPTPRVLCTPCGRTARVRERRTCGARQDFGSTRARLLWFKEPFPDCISFKNSHWPRKPPTNRNTALDELLLGFRFF